MRFDEEWRLLVRARTWLGERGYRLVDSRGPEGMEQGFDIYVGESLAIRIVADRGTWSVDVRPGRIEGDWFGYEGWFDLEEWSTCLRAPVVFHDTRQPVSDQDWVEVIESSWRLSPQLEYLRGHLATIEEACHPTRVEQTKACLEESERRRMPSPA